MSKLCYLICIVFFLVNCFVCNSQDKDVITATVEFVINTNDIIKNDDYEYFVNDLVPFIKYGHNNIESIILIGSASPEGNAENNLYLADIRSEKICSYIDSFVPRSKIIVNNDYGLFLEKTGLDESDYRKLRATYIEIIIKNNEIDKQIDTVYIHDTVVDTVYSYETVVDTVYLTIQPKTIPIIGLKTNVLGNLAVTPNVQAEIYTHLAGLSVEFNYSFPWWHIDDNKYFYYQILNGIVGIRKYFRNTYVGHYVGIYGNTAIYDICLFNKDIGWQGEAYGAGISYGYVFQSKKYQRLKFEPYIKIGWLNTRYDTYHASQPFDEKYYYNWNLSTKDFVPRRFVMNYFGPIAIGFSLTFDLVCLKKY